MFFHFLLRVELLKSPSFKVAKLYTSILKCSLCGFRVILVTVSGPSNTQELYDNYVTHIKNKPKMYFFLCQHEIRLSALNTGLLFPDGSVCARCSDGALIAVLPLRLNSIQKETQSCSDEQGEEKDECPPHSWGQGLSQPHFLCRQQVT